MQRSQREREWEHLIDDVWYFEAELTVHWFRDCRNHDWNGTVDYFVKAFYVCHLFPSPIAIVHTVLSYRFHFYFTCPCNATVLSSVLYLPLPVSSLACFACPCDATVLAIYWHFSNQTQSFINNQRLHFNHGFYNHEISVQSAPPRNTTHHQSDALTLSLSLSLTSLQLSLSLFLSLNNLGFPYCFTVTLLWSLLFILHMSRFSVLKTVKGHFDPLWVFTLSFFWWFNGGKLGFLDCLEWWTACGSSKVIKFFISHPNSPFWLITKETNTQY